MSVTTSPDRVSRGDFTRAFRHHPAGVAIITADAGDGPVAMTVSSVASVSIDPPTLIFSASAMSSSTPTIRRAETVVVHLLTAAQVHLAKLGARSGVERFGDEVRWDRLPTGEPYYPDASAWLRGRIVERIDVHGSTVVVVEALEAGPDEEAEAPASAPLVYHDRKWFVLTERAQIPAAVLPYYAVYGRGDD